MAQNIFAYGTLMLPEIVFALTKKNFVMKEGTLKDYRRYKVNDPNREQKGPAIIKEEGYEVKGKVIFDVGDKTIKLLDKFEGRSYEKRKVLVSVDDNKIEAIMYLGANFNKDFLYGDWDLEEFKQKYLDFYIKKRIPQILGEIN